VVSHETMRQWTLKFGQSFELNASFRQPLETCCGYEYDRARK